MIDLYLVIILITAYADETFIILDDESHLLVLQVAEESVVLFTILNIYQESVTIIGEQNLIVIIVYFDTKLWSRLRLEIDSNVLILNYIAAIFQTWLFVFITEDKTGIRSTNEILVLKEVKNKDLLSQVHFACKSAFNLLVFVFTDVYIHDFIEFIRINAKTLTLTVLEAYYMKKYEVSIAIANNILIVAVKEHALDE